MKTKIPCVFHLFGFLGTVKEVRDDTFQIEIAEGVRVRILKSAVQTKRLPQNNNNNNSEKTPEQGASA